MDDRDALSEYRAGYLHAVSSCLDIAPAEKAELMREIWEHYTEVTEELVTSGVDPDDVPAKVRMRLGDPVDIALRLQAVHCQAGWAATALTVLPVMLLGIIGLMGSMKGVLGSAAGHAYALCIVTFVAGSAWQLARGRRPVWLATWLSAAIVPSAYAFTRYVSQAMSLALHVHPEIRYESGGWGGWIDVSMGALALVLGGVAILVFCPRHRFRRAVSVLCVLLVSAVLMVSPSLWALIPLALVYVAVLIGIPVRVFALHPYGTLAQASLFLFSLISFTQYGSPMISLPARLFVLVLHCVFVLGVARAGSQSMKLSVLSFGSFTLCVAAGLSGIGVVWYRPAGLESLPFAIIGLLLVAVVEWMIVRAFVLDIPSFLARRLSSQISARPQKARV